MLNKMFRVILFLLLFVAASWGQISGCPTGSTKYLVPSSYATITLAEAALPGNLSGLGIQCIEVTAGTYNESVAIAGPTNPSASDRIYLVAAVGSEHKGSFGAGVVITNSTGFYIVSPQVDYCYIRDIVGKHSNAGQTGFNSFGRTNTVYERVLYKNEGDATNRGFVLNGDGETAILCVAWNPMATSSADGFQTNTSGTVSYYNCVSSGFLNSFRRVGGTLNAYNSIGIKYAGGGGSDFVSISSANYLASSDASAGGISPLINQSGGDFNFVDVSTGNFHYASASGNMYNSGVDQSGVFTVDIDLQTITTWMRGVDFFVAGGAGGSSDCGGRLRRMGLAPCGR